ncbi:response regulator transcription factor [Paenibacillus sedimenti]|uniref:Response regulator transcription factor n=1 Tax=Paenibacillus sedimenti TaxID=2770274 RepID=A0A926KME0_9BACL|nr:response regulator transcription factor [Paenibacillus sedimenti]MBD0379957.1 response regulator transcription factor [Paenibacillus sedimenti]
MRTVMVVEDEPLMRELIADYMKDEGFRVVEAKNGAEALDKFAQTPADAVVLDVMMPYLDGFGVCQFLRKTSDAVIVIVTAKSEETDKLYGYELGADDYVTKPFSPKVLVAKVKALLKRVGNHGEADTVIVYRVEGLEIREQSYELLVDGQRADLTPKEFELLLYLYRNRNFVQTREALLNGVWGYEYDGDTRNVDAIIKRLRQKMGPYAGLIHTVRGNGYVLRVRS